MPSEGFGMALSLFRSKWGQKGHDVSAKSTSATSPHHNHDNDDDDDNEERLTRDPIRRNSRFYRSMRKKNRASAELQDGRFRHCGSFKSRLVHNRPECRQVDEKY